MTEGRYESAPDAGWRPPSPRSPVARSFDIPLPAYAPAPPTPARRRSRAPLAAVAALATVLAVVLAGMAWSQYSNSHGAAAAVRGYFQAVASGDAVGALAYAAVPPPASDGQYLTDTVLAEQLKIGPIHNIAVLGTRTSDGQTVVAVRYTLGFSRAPQVVQDSVPVVRRGRAWRLVRAAVNVSVEPAAAGADRLTFAGRPVPTSSVLVFPGALPVQTDIAAVEIRRPPYAALSQDMATLQVTDSLTDGATHQLDDAVQKAMQACLAPTSSDPLCPSVRSERQVPGSLHGKLDSPIAQSVTFVLLADSGHGVVSFEADVSVDANYQVWDFNNIAQPRSGVVTVQLHAVASVDNLSKIYWTGSDG